MKVFIIADVFGNRIVKSNHRCTLSYVETVPVTCLFYY